MSNTSDMEHYLESISIFYDEKLKFLSTKDNFLRCKGCPTKKIFKEDFDEISLSCGSKGDDDNCGMKITIKFPKYIHYENDMKLLKNELETGLNLETINEHMDVSENIKKDTRKRKEIEEKMKDITDKFYKINVQNKKKDIENFYRSRVEKTKRCREILRDIDNFEESEKTTLRKEYISLIKNLNKEYIEIKQLIETFQPFYIVKKPEVVLLMNVESEKKKIKKKPKKISNGEKEHTFSKGDVVHWEAKGQILTGFIKSEKEQSGLLKIVNEEGKTFYVPKGKVKSGEGEIEPEPEKPEEEQVEEEQVEEEQVEEEVEEPEDYEQEKLYYNNSKENKWLSTFNVAEPFKYNGMEYSSVENAFHAQKLDDEDPMHEEYRLALSTNVNDILKPNVAKKFGEKESFKLNGFTLRNDWDSVKLKIMEEITREYYMVNKHLIGELIESGEKLLVHKGFRIDGFWGVNKKDEGNNNHGNILMKLREEFKNA